MARLVLPTHNHDWKGPMLLQTRPICITSVPVEVLDEQDHALNIVSVGMHVRSASYRVAVTTSADLVWAGTAINPRYNGC